MGHDQHENSADEDDAEEQTDGGHEDKRAAAVVRLDQIARKFPTYEDFLDSQVTEMDMFYLEDRSIARTIKELGFHGNSEKITREQFNEKKAKQAVAKKIEEFKSGAKYLYTDRDVFLLELARREDANLRGRLVTVIYIRDRNGKGQEISSYIDYAQRLQEGDFASIFAGRERLNSKIMDLSHFNWDTNVTHSNNSPNFDIIFHGHGGIQLKCKKDMRIIHLDPNRQSQIVDTNVEDTTRTLIRSRNYAQVVLFDHFIRFWANEDDAPQDEEKLPVGPNDNEHSMEAGLDLFDNVTAAIYEDDLLEIARNALGGNLYQEHNGEWAPADVLMDGDRPAFTAEPTSSTPPADSLENSVFGTMKDLYNAHKNDISFGTLGNFTFIQMIEQLGRLLPEKTRAKTELEAVKIGEGTANVKVKIPEQDLPPVEMDADELVETYAKIPTSKQADMALAKDPAYYGQVVLPEEKIQSQIPPKKEVLSKTTSASELFDPVPHIGKIKELYPRKISIGEGKPEKMDGKNSSEKVIKVDVAKKKSSTEKLTGSKDHSEYFKQLETRMGQIFHGTLKDASNLPAYTKIITLQNSGKKTS